MPDGLGVEHAAGVLPRLSGSARWCARSQLVRIKFFGTTSTMLLQRLFSKLTQQVTGASKKLVPTSFKS